MIRRNKSVIVLSIFFSLLALPVLAYELKDSSVYTQSVRSLIGHKIVRVEILQDNRISGVMLSEARALEGSAFDMGRIQKLLRWFHDGIGEGRLDFFAENTDEGIVVHLHLLEKKIINTMQFEGNKSFSADELVQAAGIGKSEVYSFSKIERALQAIKVFYRDNGFYDAEVNFIEESRGNLRIKIVENQRLIIEDVQLSPISSVEDEATRERLMDSLLSALDLEEGSNLTREKIDNGILNIREWLRSNDFLTATDPQVNLLIAENRRSARISVDIRYGPRIRIGFRNNSLFSYRELMSVISEVKDLELGRGYMAQVEAKLKQLYQTRSHYNVAVRTEIKENNLSGYRRISIVIDEGNRIKINKLEFRGISSIPRKKVEELFDGFSPTLLQKRFYMQEDIKIAGDLIAERLRSSGYVSARLDIVRLEFNEDRTEVDVYLFFTEGVKTVIESIQINNNAVFTKEEIYKVLNVQPNQPFDIFKFEKGIRALKEGYFEEGYLTMRILNEGADSLVQYSEDLTQVRLRFDLFEGPLIRVGDVIVRGNQKTKTRVITREIPFANGDVLTKLNLGEAEEKMRKLGLFATIIVKPIERPTQSEIRDVLILVEESSPGAVEFGPGYRTDLGLRLFARVSYQNLGGWHRGVFVQGVVNRRIPSREFQRLEYNVSVGFREPWFAGWPVTFNTTLSFFHQQFSTFDASFIRLSNVFSRELTKNITGFFDYSLERILLKDISDKSTILKQERDGGIRVIGAITPSLVFDFRDDRFNPTDGFRSRSSLELADRFLASQEEVGYYRFTTQNTFYFPVFKQSVLQVAANYGFQRSNIRGEVIPPTKLFNLGGVTSIRGYPERSIGADIGADTPDKVVSITGTLSYLVYRAEFHTPLGNNFRWAFFADAGNLFIDRIEPFNVRTSVGTGFRYVTPVGPVLLDFAYKLDSLARLDRGIALTDEAKREKWRIHFSIGVF